MPVNTPCLPTYYSRTHNSSLRHMSNNHCHIFESETTLITENASGDTIGVTAVPYHPRLIRATPLWIRYVKWRVTSVNVSMQWEMERVRRRRAGWVGRLEIQLNIDSAALTRYSMVQKDVVLVVVWIHRSEEMHTPTLSDNVRSEPLLERICRNLLIHNDPPSILKHYMSIIRRVWSCAEDTRLHQISEVNRTARIRHPQSDQADTCEERQVSFRPLSFTHNPTTPRLSTSHTLQQTP